ncbi:hypothetical protein LRAMOSA02832 [Lichtheimia ramosa]|uniref:PX domain-containing protein n=1 Tax=Lichtheimia ramosa TaxID=688394 RepID=A0A077WS32_9FUNG|nr:hypothetical protein LRAMOSA02832 [Lichtheimia ramosa]
MDYHHYEQQQQLDTPLIFNITTVDYNRKDPVFWIETITTLTKYKHKTRRIPRYYSELERLHDLLLTTLDDAYIPVLPPCPRPRYDRQGRLLSRYWWYQQQDNELPTPDIKIQQWLDRIADHERVQQSEGLREFVESEVGFRPQRRKKVKRHKRRTSINHDDLEPEFWQLNDHINTFRTCLVQLETAWPSRGNTSVWSDLASAWVAYGGIERDPVLFILYKNIAKGCQQIHHLEVLQDMAATDTLGDEITYQISNAENAQNIMEQRLSVLSDYFISRKRTESSLRNVERLKSSSSIDRERASDAIAELEEARRIEQNALQKYERIDGNYDRDLEYRYKPQLASDMINAIREYAKSQLVLEKQKLATWENVYSCMK